MSLEAALAENTAAATALAEVMKTVAANQDRLLAGQEAALQKLDEKAGSPARQSRATKAADDKKATATGDEKQPAVAADKKSGGDAVTDEMLANAGALWMKDKSKEEKQDAFVKLTALLEHFGKKGEKLTGPEATLDGDQRKQALFFIRRWQAGLDVDFSADYDFDGDPKQGAPAAADEGDENPFG